MSARVGRILLVAGAVLILIAVIFMTAGPLAPSRIAARLEVSAQQALEDREHGWARVRMEGQVAHVSGVAPSEFARGDAIAAVRGAVWAGGVVAGGITRVIDETSTARLERGFAFRVDAGNGRAQISGDAPDAASRDRLSEVADSLFPAGAQADLTLAPGGAPSEAWTPVAERILGQLARLDRGSAVMIRNQAALIGDAANPQAAQSVAAALSGLPEPYHIAVLIRPAGAPSVARIQSADGCAAALEAARGPDLLRFDSGAASASPGTRRALGRMARTFSFCPDGLRLDVAIRVEEDGEALAAQRASEVIALLAGAGLDEARLSPVLDGSQDRLIEFEIHGPDSASGAAPGQEG